MNDEIAVFENPGLDDAIHSPGYFSGELEQHLLQQRIPVSGRSIVTQAAGTAPAIIEITVPTGLLEGVESAVVQFLTDRTVKYRKEAKGKLGARTIYYHFDRPVTSP